VFQIATLSMHCPAVQLYEFLRDHSTLKDETGLTAGPKPSMELPLHFIGHATELLVRCPRMSLPVYRLCMSVSMPDEDREISVAAMSIALFHAIVDGNREITNAIVEYNASGPLTVLYWLIAKLMRGQGYLHCFNARGSFKHHEPPCIVQFFENNIREMELEPKSLPALFDAAIGIERFYGTGLSFIHVTVRSHPRESLRVWLTTEFAEFSELWPDSMWSHFDMDMASDDAVYTTVNNRVSVDGWSEILDAHENNFPMMKIVVPRLFSIEAKESGFMVYRDMLKSKAAESPNISSALQSIVVVGTR